MRRKITALLAMVSMLFSLTAVFAETSSPDVPEPRQMEYLDRGTVAVKVSKGVYLSWRLLGTENYDTAFDIYRGNTKIATVSDSTNYTDTSGTLNSTYTVVPQGTPKSEGKTVIVWQNPYLTIPLDVPAGGTIGDVEYTYTANDATCADLDGDGEYEIILKWDPSNSFDSGSTNSKPSGNVYIDAYKLDGTKLWRIDLGVNIPAGAHFTQISAYDFDLDGKAEIAMKTAPGSIDGENNYVTAASSISAIRNADNTIDYRNQSGRALSGDEYYTVFQGDTGKALDTVYYPHPRGTIKEWGDSWGNRSERYLAAVAYLDGIHPSMVTWRGYYGKTTVAAYNLVNKKLVKIADFNTDTYSGPFSDKRLTGNGNHNLTVADVDNDGKDEIISGAIALEYINGDFSVLWCSEKGHGDALHLADYDPIHKGMEYFAVHESSPYGMTVYDAATGNVLFHKDAGGDTGRGMMANVGYSDGYYDIWGAGVYTCYGKTKFREASFTPASTNFRIFWDGNTYDELLDGTGSYNTWIKIDGKNGRVATLTNCSTNNYTKNNPCLQADLFGDWREEVVVRSGNDDNQSLLIFTTAIETNHKLYTLMHDGAYRMQVAAQNSGYNQPPHIGYYISETKDVYDMREYAAYVKTVHNGITAVRSENIIPPQIPEPVEDSVIYTQNLESIQTGQITGKAETVEDLEKYSVPDFGTGTNETRPYPALDGWGYMHYGLTSALTSGRQSSVYVDASNNVIYAQGVDNAGCNSAVSFIPANVDNLVLPQKGSLIYEFDVIVEVTGGSKTGSPKLGFTSAPDGSTVWEVASVPLAAELGVTKIYSAVMRYDLDNHAYMITIDGERKAEGSLEQITGIYIQNVNRYIRIGIANLVLKSTEPAVSPEEPPEKPEEPSRFPYNITAHSFEGNNINYRIKCTGAPEAAKLLVGAYDENGKLVGLKIGTITGDEQTDFILSIEDFGDFGGKIRAFIWSENMRPLCEVYEI